MDRKNPEHYQIEDFVTDESFINYHFHHNSEDHAFWEDWLAIHPENRGLVEKAKEMLQSLSLTLSDVEFQKEFSRMKKAIRYEQPYFKIRKPALVRLLNWGIPSHLMNNRKSRLIKFLVPALMLLFVSAYLLLQHFTKESSQIVQKYNESSKPVVFTLSDSTVVTLAPHSVLQYPKDFENRDRKVYLDGEAQFHVSRDIVHPFKVYAGGVVATVLGTIFTVKRESTDSAVWIELLKGKLKVETFDKAGAPAQSIILNPDERVVYNHHDKKLYKETWQSHDEKLVQPTHLLFRKNNFEEIATQLKAVFGVTVINESNKKAWRFTGEFRNSSARDIVESICIVEKLSFQVQGDTIFIR